MSKSAHIKCNSNSTSFQRRRSSNKSNLSYNLAILFIVLQLLLGLTFITITEYYKIMLSKYVGNTEKEQISIAYSVMILFGLQVFVTNLCGIPLAKKCLNDPYTHHLSWLLTLWFMFAFMKIISGLVLFWFFYRSMPNLKQTIEISLLRGIDSYYSNPEWRLIWDDMQYRQQCCGVHSYKDWQTMTWLDQEETETETDEDNYPDTNKKVNKRYSTNPLEAFSLTPYSCCKENCNCFSGFLPDKSSDNTLKLPLMNLTAINTEGCFESFSVTIDSSVGFYFILFITALIFEVIILVLFRYMFIKNREYFPIPYEDVILDTDRGQSISEQHRNYNYRRCKKRNCPCIRLMSDNELCDEDDENPQFSGLIVH